MAEPIPGNIYDPSQVPIIPPTPEQEPPAPKEPEPPPDSTALSEFTGAPPPMPPPPPPAETPQPSQQTQPTPPPDAGFLGSTAAPPPPPPEQPGQTAAQTWQQYAPSLKVDEQGRLVGVEKGKVGALQEMIKNGAPADVISDFIEKNPDVAESLTGAQIVVPGVDADGNKLNVVVKRDEYNDALDIKDSTVKLNRLIELGIYPPDTKIVAGGTPEGVALFNAEFGANLSADFPYLTPGQEENINAIVRQRGEYENLVEAGVVTPSDITIPPEGSRARTRYTEAYWKKVSAAQFDIGKAVELGVPFEKLETAGINVSGSTYQAYQSLNQYRGLEGYDTVAIMQGIKDGKVSTDNLETVFGNEYAASLNRMSGYVRDGAVDVESIVNDVESGELSKSVATIIIPDDVFRQVKEYNDAAAIQQRVYSNIVTTAARLANVEIGDPSSLTESEIYRLLKSGKVEPASLVAAGNSVGKVNIAIATLSDEYEKQQDLLAKIEPYGTTDTKPSTWQETIAGFGGTGETTYTVTQLAQFLDDYPDGEIALRDAGFKDSFIADAKEYQQNLKQGTSYINDYFKTPEFGSEGYALSNAIDSLGIKLPPIPYSYNIQTGLYEDRENNRVLSQKDLLKIHWDSLTESQKRKVVEIFSKDPTKGSYFAAINATYNQIAEKGGIAGTLIFAPILPVTNVVAKQITLDEAKRLLADEYRPELDALSGYLNRDGTFNIKALDDALYRDIYREEERRILDATGYSDIESLKTSLDYYNKSVQVQPDEWALAGGVALADVLSFGGSGALSGLGTAGAWTSRVLWGAGGALFVPSAITTIKNPQAETWEKVLAGSAPVLMLVGAATVKPGISPARAQAIRGGIIEIAVEKLPLQQRIGNSLERLGYQVGKFVADENAGSLRTTGVSIPLRAAANTAVNQVVTKLIEAKSYVKYGITSDITAALKSNLADFKIAGEFARQLRENIKAGATLSVQTVETAMRQAFATAKGIPSEVATFLRERGEFISQAAKDMYDEIIRTYNRAKVGVENAVDDAALKALNAEYYIRYELQPDIVRFFNRNKVALENLADSIGLKAVNTYTYLNTTLPQYIKYLATELKIDVKQLASMTATQAQTYLENAIRAAHDTALRTRSYITYDLPRDFMQSLMENPQLVKEIAGNIRRTFNRTKVNIENFIDNASLKSLNAEAYLKYGLDRDINRIIQRNKLIAEYLAERAKKGYQQGIEDVRLTRTLKDIQEALSRQDETVLKQSARDLKNVVDDLPDDVAKPYKDAADTILENADDWAAEGWRGEEARSTVGDVDRWLKNLETARETEARAAADLWDIYLKAKTDAETIANRLWELNKRQAIDDIETYLKSLNKSKDEISEYLDQLNKAETVDDIAEWLLSRDQRFRNTEFTSWLDDAFDNLKDKQDKGEPIAPDDLDNLPERGGGGTRAAVKEKTETKPKTADELDELFKTEEEVKPETEIKTETPSETKPVTRTMTEVTPSVIPPEIPGELGVISYPFDPDLNPDAAREYERLLRELGYTRGYIEEKKIPDTFKERVDELSRTMTRTQAIKQVLEEFEDSPTSFESAAVSPFTITSADIEGLPSTSPFRQPQPQPLPQPEPVPFESPFEETDVETATESETEPFTEPFTRPVEQPVEQTRPLPEPSGVAAPPRQIDTETRRPPPPPPPGREFVSDEEARRRIKPGTITWRQGLYWRVLPPPYGQEDFFAMASAPPGIYKYATGKGSARKTLQVIGGPPAGTATVDLGWARIRLTPDNRGEVSIEYLQDADANTGKREFTVGMGAGQIPIEVWKEGKAQGKTLEEVGREWQAEREMQAERIPREPQYRPIIPVSEIEPPDGQDILAVRRRVTRYGTGRMYLGRELPGVNYDVSL